MIGKGLLGVILMRALGMDYADVQEALDYIEVFAKKHGYTITVTKID